MMVRTQISLDFELHREARRHAAELGVSLAELTRRALRREVEGPSPLAGDEIETIFDLGRSSGSDIARDKDRYLADASQAEYERKMGLAPRD